MISSLKQWLDRGKRIEELQAQVDAFHADQQNFITRTREKHERRTLELEAEVQKMKDDGERAVKELIQDREFLLRDLQMYERKLDKLDPLWRQRAAKEVA